MHQNQTALWSQTRCDAKARSGRENLRGVQILPPDRHQRHCGTAVNDRTKKRGQVMHLPHFSAERVLRRTVFSLFSQSGIFQEDLYPMTAGNQPAMTAQEWLSGMNRGQSCSTIVTDNPSSSSPPPPVSFTSPTGPVLMSLKPGTRVANPYPENPAEMGSLRLRPGVGAAPGENFPEEVANGIESILKA